MMFCLWLLNPAVVFSQLSSKVWRARRGWGTWGPAACGLANTKPLPLLSLSAHPQTPGLERRARQRHAVAARLLRGRAAAAIPRPARGAPRRGHAAAGGPGLGFEQAPRYQSPGHQESQEMGFSASELCNSDAASLTPRATPPFAGLGGRPAARARRPAADRHVQGGRHGARSASGGASSAQGMATAAGSACLAFPMRPPTGPLKSPLPPAPAPQLDFQDSVGAAVHAIVRTVPGGVLMFMPSYALMDKLTRRWQVGGPGAGSRGAGGGGSCSCRRTR
jgi:hypothetical protein